ncbi:phage head morphogenesis protein [Porphyromonas asaccharolytica]
MQRMGSASWAIVDKEASELLLDERTGKLKSFNKFYQDVSAIREKYNRNWLHAEYNFAVSSAQMASHWAEYQQDEEMANLQYRTTLDDKVRPEHAALEGVTLPMSTPFWDTAFPPNGWNCRCHVIPVLKEDFPLSNSQRAQDAFDDMTEGKASIFRYNPDKEGVIFPPHHPYYGKRGYKHCLNPHLATSLGDNEKCKTHNKLDGIEDLKQVQASAKDAVREKKAQIDPFKGKAVDSSNAVTGLMLILRSFLKSIQEHAVEDINIQHWLCDYKVGDPIEMRYIGWGKLRQRADGTIKHIREAACFTYYETKIGGETYYLNCKVHLDYNNKEVLYSIERNKPSDLLEGEPVI